MIWIIIAIIVIIAALLNGEPTHEYKAEFGNNWEYLSRFNHGIAVTGSKAISKNLSHENVALFGPTGSGKSTVVIMSSAKSLAAGKSSMIFNDVSGEIYSHTSGYLANQGYKILRVDFSNAVNSETFNPLLSCHSISDIQKTALLIYKNASGESKGDLFWEQSSIMLLSLFIRYVVFYTDPEFRTLQNVLRLIEKFAVDGKAVDKLFARTGDEDLLSSYKAMLVVGDKTLQSIVISARVALSLFNDTEVCRATATNSIDFDLLRKEPVALYVCNPLKDLLYFKPLSALFFQTLFNYILSRIPNEKERSIFVILDEAATMRFPNLSTTIANIRKHQAGLLICLQDEQALIAQYGQAEAHQIKTNCGCQIYLKGQPLSTTRDLSQILGKYSFWDDKEIQRTRELMTPDEIRMSEEAIILINNKPPLKCKTVPYYENMWMKEFTQMPPYQLPLKEVVNPPLIQFS